MKNHSRNAGKHALEDSEEQVWNLAASNRRLSEDVSEADVGHITNVTASSMRESERVSPEEPLKGDDSDGHDGEPYQRKRGFSSRETRVEEAVRRC
jgi:hypothetical protein